MFAYDGRRYVEATRQYPDHIGADLEEVLGALEAALEAGAPFEEVAGWALGAFGDHVLLGQTEEGLASIRKRVPPQVATWLDRHAAQAAALVAEHFRPGS